MMNIGLSTAQKMELYELLHTSHRLHIRLQLMDLNHKYIGDLSPMFMEGTVDIDSTADITRSTSLTLFDQTRSLQLASDDPDEGAAFPSRMIQIWYCVGNIKGTKWYEIPIFTGPVTKADRDGFVLSVECVGKEILGMNAVWTARTWKKGWNKVALAVAMLREMGGETKFDVIKDSKATSPKQIAIVRGGVGPYNRAKALGRSLGLHTFYDGRGYFRIRRYPSKPSWTFSSAWTADDPQVSFNIDELINAVEITGAKPKGAKKPVSWRGIAPAAHPLSPQSLARGGVPQYKPYVEQNSDLRTVAECKEYGETILRNGLLQGIDMSFECFPVPLLEEGDILALGTDTYSTSTRLQQATIPLKAGEFMSVGFNKKVKPSKLSRRLRRA